MPVVPEDGTGVVGADAYGAVSAITAYWAARPQRTEAAAWAAATTTVQDGGAREAAAYVDATWGAYFIGYRASHEQGLEWPRIGGIDEDGAEIALTDALGREIPALPAQLLSAVAELAGRAVSAPLAADAETSAGVKSRREKVGPLEEAVEYSTPDYGQASYGMVLGMLAPLLNGSQPGSATATWFWR